MEKLILSEDEISRICGRLASEIEPKLKEDKYGIPVVEDAAEGMGSRFNGQVLGTFGKYGVLSFNGNKMITTSGGGALICRNPEEANEIMWYATQARDAYPYYQHTAIGYNYRMSNVCAGIGRGQMTVLDAHIAHHKRNHHNHSTYAKINRLRV